MLVCGRGVVVKLLDPNTLIGNALLLLKQTNNKERKYIGLEFDHGTKLRLNHMMDSI